MRRLGLAQGRFHVIHKGHMEYLLACAERCDFLFIGISDPDPSRAYFSRSIDYKDDPAEAEPYITLEEPRLYALTYYERAMMIQAALAEEGIGAERIMTVPFPVHRMNLIKYYVPKSATVYVTIYDEWGEQKVDIFRKVGYEVEILWRRSMAERFTTATEVRRLIKAGDESWKELVPPAVVKIAEELGVAERYASL
ncbi:nicotinamide mononucleotide adenylyltransferase [Limisalsivibrio acetivorans]|uniref:nicotinamide mononucleotide adenylyltransferase n=1 Tax=Limisalsivibrio acetivorans TaxID=1304888 RepID=UPI0003B5348F|nr:nicotinamide mononucleotide adenylyltransferase [Limisalsivibrio acetivorans]